MSNLLQEIEAQISGAKTATAKQNVGVVREIGDGVAKIEGLTDTMLNEMLDFGNGVTGLRSTSRKPKSARSSWAITPASRKARKSARPANCLQVPVGKALLGRVVNALGQPLDGKGRSRKRHFIRSKKSRRASSSANPSASRCRPASWRLTR
jgi:F-type H+-transporting ATPase subunit alpha